MDIINISLLALIVVDLILVILTMIGNDTRDTVNRWYLVNVATIVCWIGFMILYRISSQDTILSLTKSLYVSATFVASSFYYFSYIFPRSIKDHKNKLIYIVSINMLIGLLTIFTDKIILSAQVNTLGENIINFGDLYFIYVLYILYFFSAGFVRLFLKYYREPDHTVRAQIFFLVMGYSLSGNIAFISNLLLPWFKIFTFNWIGQVATITMVVSITYAILRHKLFNIKIAGTAALTFTLSILTFSQIIFARDSSEILLRTIVFILVLFFSILLMRGVLKEVQQREKIEILATGMEKANVRLKELDQMKTEFISLATHQIRGPLTAIKGYISLVQEGDYGPVNQDVSKALDIVFNSTNNLVTIVGDFLDVSRIEQGRMKYDFTDFDLQELVNQVISEYKPNVDKRGLALNYEYDKTKAYMVHADRGKVKQIFGNILDNSIKYTPQGKIDVSLDAKDKKALITIADTGVGIPLGTMPKLFQKFTRASNANEANILGTGLGLYVARQMMEAHKGRIWAESEGEGKGSQFYIELETLGK